MADAEDAVRVGIFAGVRPTAAECRTREHLLLPRRRGFVSTCSPRRARHEEYAGPWLLEPILDIGALAPDSHTEHQELAGNCSARRPEYSHSNGVNRCQETTLICKLVVFAALGLVGYLLVR